MKLLSRYRLQRYRLKMSHPTIPFLYATPFYARHPAPAPLWPTLPVAVPCRHSILNSSSSHHSTTFLNNSSFVTILTTLLISLVSSHLGTWQVSSLHQNASKCLKLHQNVSKPT